MSVDLALTIATTRRPVTTRLARFTVPAMKGSGETESYVQVIDKINICPLQNKSQCIQ